jgi:branched-chain amino acid transport system ATP-binding protein
MSAEAVVSAAGVTRRFGGLTAVDGISFEVRNGEVFGIVGPNGAGKSTMLAMMAGQVRPSSGRLVVCGHDVKRLRPADCARAGIGIAHQTPRPFRRLTVGQNLAVAAQVVSGRTRRRQVVADSLQLTSLLPLVNRPAGELGLLDLKRLGLARALALDPRLLLLDEVAAGLTGADLDELIKVLAVVKDSGCAMVLVEHVQDVIQELADRVLVMDRGRALVEGTPAEVALDPRVIDSYLGAGAALSTTRGPASTGPAPVVLHGERLTVDYGHVRALSDVTLEVRSGEIIAVLGANGAGKTTLAKALQGLVRLTRGSVQLRGKDVTRLSPHRRLVHGYALCPEGRRLFGTLSVRENLELGLLGRDTAALDVVYDLFPELIAMNRRPAGALSGGEQQMVAIGRALASRPSVVVFDELSLGLAPVVVDRVFDAVLRIASSGTAVVLIEQNIRKSTALSNTVLLLRRGRQVYSGPPDGLTEAEFQDAYLGAAASPHDGSAAPAP